MTETPYDIKVYGASWCPDCRRAKQFLGSHRVPYEWHDLDAEPEAIALVEQLNGGKRIIPTIVFPNGDVLAEPSNDILADQIGLSRETMAREYDLVIVGAGPTGLTTAIYGARENLKVLVVEKSATGGQAGVTERLDNYPGFPDGVGGAELADRMTQQALRYGVEIVQAVSVQSISRTDCGVEIALSTGKAVTGTAVVVATGSTYRRTDADGEADLIGAGIHFCATCDGPFYRGAPNVTVIGGGNSGLEEGLFLTEFANHVTVVQAIGELTANKLLQEKVLAHPKMSVMLNSAVSSFNANSAGKLESVSLATPSGPVVHPTSAAFVFIGLDPNSQLLRGLTALDERGFVVTSDTFATDLEGVFVAGDVRSGSTKQLASAVGEGAAVAIQVRNYLTRLANEK